MRRAPSTLLLLALTASLGGCPRGCERRPPRTPVDAGPPGTADDLAAFLVHLLPDGSDWYADQSERWLAALLDEPDLAAAERFAARGGPWTRASSLAQLATAYARRGDAARARERLAQARDARARLLGRQGQFPVGDWTHGILARDGDTALLVRLWTAETALALPEARDTRAAIDARPPSVEFSPHLFRAWIDAGEIDRATDVAARKLRQGWGPRELSDLGRVVDGATLARVLSRLPSFDQDPQLLYDLVDGNARAAGARGDFATAIATAFGYGDRMPRLRDPCAWIADQLVSDSLRRGDEPHARAVVDRWREHVGREPVRLYVAIARVEGVSAAERWATGRTVPRPLAHAVAGWILDETDGTRVGRVPPLGHLADDARTIDAILDELHAIAREDQPLSRGPIAHSRGTRAAVLARVVERRLGRADGWDDLVREAERSHGPGDELAAIARGAAECGDLDDAFALLERVVAADRRLPDEDRPLRSWEIARLVVAEAERRDFRALVRALALDDHIIGVTPNGVDHALEALPRVRR